jgi:hypothetical protein
MDSPKAYTVRTETGEIRLITQEEVGDLVRTSLRQQQQNTLSKKVSSSLSPSPRGTSKKKAVIMSTTKSANGPTTETIATSLTKRFQFPATTRRLSRHNWSSRRRQRQQQQQQQQPPPPPKQQHPQENRNMSPPEREDEVEAVVTNNTAAAEFPSMSSSAVAAFDSTRDGSDNIKTPTISNHSFSERESRNERSTSRVVGTSPFNNNMMMTSSDERFTAMVSRSFPIKTEKEGLQNMSETEINDLVRNSIQRARRQLQQQQQQQYNNSNSIASPTSSPPPLSPRLRKFSWSFDNETEEVEERDDACTQKEEGGLNDKGSTRCSEKETQDNHGNVGTTANDVPSSTMAIATSPKEEITNDKPQSDTMTLASVLSDKEISQMVEKTLEKPFATVEGPIWEVTDIVQDTMRRASALASASSSHGSNNDATEKKNKKNPEEPKPISENGGEGCGIECSLSGNFHTASTTLASSSASTAASASSLSSSSNKEQQDKEEETPPLSPNVEKKASDDVNFPTSSVTHPDSNQDANDDNSLITKEWNITIVSGGRDVVGSEGGDYPEDEDGVSLGKGRKNVASATAEPRDCKNVATGKNDKSDSKIIDEGSSSLSDKVLLEESSPGKNTNIAPHEPTVSSKATDCKADTIPDCLSDPEAYTLNESSPELHRKSKALALAKSSIAFTSLILSQKATSTTTTAGKKKRAQGDQASFTADTKDYPPSVDKPTASEIDPESWEPLIPPASALKSDNKEETCTNEKDSTHGENEKCDSEKNTPRWQNGRLVKRDFSDAGKRQHVSTRILSILASEVSPSAESKKKIRSRRFRRAKYASKPIGSSGPRKSKSDKQIPPEKDGTSSGSMVITDEFLAEIASKNGSTISPEELSQMIHTATKSHNTTSSTDQAEDAEEETTTIEGTTATATIPTVANSSPEVEIQTTESASSVKRSPSKKMSSEEPLPATKTGFCMDCLDLFGFVDDDDPCFLEDDFTVNSRNETTWEDDDTTIIDQTEDENAGDTTDAENGAVEVTDRGDDDAEFDEAGTALFTLTSQERRRVTFSFSDGHQTMTMTDYDASSSDESTTHSGF